MNVLIIEDEEQAAKKLRRMINELLPQTFVHGPLESVADAVEWISNNPRPDLIFMDIHLGDGLCFEIFTKVEVDCPILFITAYDQYALRAFKLNSVDYLLKPVDKQEFIDSIQKFQSRFANPGVLANIQERYITAKTDYENKYKQRFITRIGDRISAVNTEDVLYAYSENKATYLINDAGKNYLVDFSLEQIEDLLNPEQFFRLNRQYIARFEAVVKMVSYSNSRLSVTLKNCDATNIILSRDKTRSFKQWIDK